MSKHRLWAPIELAAVDLPDGSMEVEQKVLVYGKQKQRDRNGIMREFEITPDTAAEMVANSDRDLGTGYEAPAFIGHPEKRDAAPSVGWIRTLKAKADGLHAVVRYLPEMAAQLKAGAFRYVSPTFTFNYEDQHGAPRGAKLLDLGVLNTPHQKDLGGIPLSESAFTLSEVEGDADASLVADNTGAGDHMTITKDELASALADALAQAAKATDEKIASAIAKFGETIPKHEPQTQLADTTDKINAKIIELNARVTKAETMLSDKDAQITKATADAESARTELDGYKRELTEGRVKALITSGIDNGTLEAKDVPGFGTDAFDATKWLAESKFNGEKGLRTHVATASPVVSFSERRKSRPESVTSDDVELSDDQIARLGFKDRAEFVKFSSMGSGGNSRAFNQ